MIRKLTGLLIALTLVLAAALPVIAAEETTAIQVDVHHETGDVVISGVVPGGGGESVTVVVIHESGQVDYINQMTAAGDGSYSFQYRLDEQHSGNYEVKVNGFNFVEAVAASFRYEPAGTEEEEEEEEEQQNGQGGKPYPAVDPGGSGRSTYVVSGEEWLRLLQSEGAELQVPGYADSVRIPLRPGSSGERAPVTLLFDRVSVQLSVRLLAALESEQQAGGAADASVTVRLNPIDRETIAAVRNEWQTTLPSGDALQIEFLTGAGAGQLRLLERLPEVAILTVDYDEGADAELLGIYRLDEATGSWTYVGARALPGTRQLQVEIGEAGQYAVLAYNKSFADVGQEHWAYQTIRSMSAKHLIQGVSEQSFAPSTPITRADFTVLLARLLKLDEMEHLPFNDVSLNTYYAASVAAAYNAGLIQGKTSDLFAPEEEISRQEMAVMLVRAYERTHGQSPSFAATAFGDQSRVSAWAADAIDGVAGLGLMKGIGNNKFAPLQSTTRAEAAQAIFNLLHVNLRKG